MSASPTQTGQCFLHHASERVSKAFRHCQEHLGLHKRPTGESYAEHSLEVADTLHEKVQNESLLSIALLHAFPAHRRGTALLAAPIQSPGEIRMMCALAPVCTHDGHLHWPQEAAMNDPRLALLSAAHCLNDIRHIKRFAHAERVRMCSRVFRSLTHVFRRLKLEDWAKEMEDRCFIESHPTAAIALQKLRAESQTSDSEILDRVVSDIRHNLKSAHARCSIQSRIKSLYATHAKMRARTCDYQSLHDRLAVRLLCPTDTDCYDVLRRIHAMYPAMQTYFKDYIREPKANGYRSLHTVVLAPVGKRQAMVEVQIRSDDMHWNSVYGSAEHVFYKAGRYRLTPDPA